MVLKLSKIIATFFGLGYAPIAPGTFGALGGFIISFILLKIGLDFNTFHLLHIFLIVVSFFAGIFACKRLSSHWGHDPSKVVIDETLGFWVSILFLPQNILSLAAGFVLFRFFDILKPWGIRKIDNLNSTYSIMLDDVVAGIYTNIILQFVFWMFVDI
jgi:phosphatidylglycerophosphatase A